MPKDSSRKILIVDDNKDLRHIYSRYLTGEGFEIFEAQNGEEALLNFRDKKIDLILLDIRMPIANGQVLIPALRQFYPQAKIIISSCYDETVQKEMIVGATDYFNKSEGYRKLLPKINAVFNSKN